MKPWRLLGLGVMLLACGGTDNTVTTLVIGTCAVTVGGTAPHTSECSVNLLSSRTTGRTTFALSDDSGVFVSLNLGAAAVHEGTYDATTVNGLVGYATNGQVWLAASHTDHDQGAFTLTLSSIGTAFASPDGVVYLGERGTLDATLPPLAGSTATGTTAVHATF